MRVLHACLHHRDAYLYFHSQVQMDKTCWIEIERVLLYAAD